MKKAVEILLVAALIVMTFTGVGYAGSSATIMVLATVMARIDQTVLHQESRISITEEDLKRGYVEVPSATILQVKTNERKGYFLHFEGGNELFKEVWVMDNGRTTVLSSHGGLIQQPSARANTELKDLSYRLHLRENTKPGHYPWPFRVKASLL